jgi:hypothetical protein
MWRGQRYRMSVNAYAIPRMQPGKQRPIQSMEEARDWERRFIGEVKAGLDPQRPPSPPPRKVTTDVENVSTFLDAYFERCAKPAALRSIGSVRSQIGVLKENLGHLPLTALEEPDEINRFKTDSEWAEDVEIASVHRVLERLRAAMNWGWRRLHRCSPGRPSTASAFAWPTDRVRGTPGTGDAGNAGTRWRRLTCASEATARFASAAATWTRPSTCAAGAK